MTDLQNIGVRKIVAYSEETLIEGGKATATPLQLFGVAAVLRNPWAGRAFEENLTPEIMRIAPVLGKALTDRIVALAGSA
ncbi:MAG: amino acid synthesis family protein, partial [Comamonas sp.]